MVDPEGVVDPEIRRNIEEDIKMLHHGVKNNLRINRV